VSRSAPASPGPLAPPSGRHGPGSPPLGGSGPFLQTGDTMTKTLTAVLAVTALIVWSMFMWFYAQRLSDGPDDPLGAIFFWLAGLGAIAFVWLELGGWGRGQS